MISIKKESITETGLEAVVNAANEDLLEGGGVCGYIFRAAGARKLQEACDRIGHCNTGDAVITPGFDLCEYIIHTVGPVYLNGFNNEPQLLYNCYRSSLQLARMYNCRSIAFPLISSGIFGYPVGKAWIQALNACNDWQNNNPDYDINIVFAVLDEDVLRMGKEAAKELGIKLN